jgi:serine phosphatase RsbU (regulator of sigma subunit)
VLKRFLLYSLFLLLNTATFGQNSDPLYLAFKNAKTDSVRIASFYKLVTTSFTDNPDTVTYYFNEAKNRINSKQLTQAQLIEKYASALKQHKANYLSSKEYKEALELYKLVGSDEDKVRVLQSLSGLSKKMDRLEDAQTYCFEGLKIAESMSDHELTASFLRSIGVNYTRMKSYQNAEKNLKRAIKYSREHNDTVGIIYGIMSLGNVFKGKEDFTQAEKYYKESLELAIEKNNQRAIAGNYNNMASNLKMQNRLDESVSYYLKAIDINKKAGNKVWESYNYNNLGNVYSTMKKFELSLKYQLMAYELKLELQDIEGLETSFLNLAEVYSNLGDYKKSAHFYDLYIESTQNSLLAQNLLNLNELSAKYEDERKIAIIAQMDTLRYMDSLQIEASNESLAKGKSLQRSMWGGVTLLILFCAYLAYSIRQKKKTNHALNNTKQDLFQKNKDLTDSINYAKFIQENILSSTRLLRDEFDETLMLYKPKDIVSGDFYWFKSFENNFVVAMADCTGHGVPGAFMSLICISAINSVTSNVNIASPGKALDRIDDIVRETLSGRSVGEANISDGMDIALCSINKETGVIQYAGAYRPLVIIRKGEVIKIKANKVSIGGKSEQKVSFSDHSVQLEKGDTVYLFTDGYPDQFGGAKGKKLKIGFFLKMLAEMNELPLSEQEAKLNEHLKLWMGDLEQVDDISVIAFRY